MDMNLSKLWEIVKDREDWHTAVRALDQSLQSCPTLRPHRLQHTRLPCRSLSPGVCSNSCPLSWWCYLTTSSSAAPFSSCPQSFSASGLPSFRVFSNELALQIRWPKYWSISFINDPSNEYSGLISFRIDWFDLLAI